MPIFYLSSKKYLFVVKYSYTLNGLPLPDPYWLHYRHVFNLLLVLKGLKRDSSTVLRKKISLLVSWAALLFKVTSYIPTLNNVPSIIRNSAG